MIKGVLFDMDGVLLDSETMYIMTDQMAAAEQGYKLTEEMFLRTAGTNGILTRQMYESFYDDAFDYVTFRATSDRLAEEYVAAGKLTAKHGLVELLPWLKERGYKLGVATSNDAAEAEDMLTAVGVFHYFDSLTSGDVITVSKPAPDIFIAAAKSLGLEPEECIAVEDSFPGVKSAAAAKCVTVMVPDKMQPTDEIRALADVVLDSLAELPAFMAEYEEKNRSGV